MLGVVYRPQFSISCTPDFIVDAESPALWQLSDNYCTLLHSFLATLNQNTSFSDELVALIWNQGYTECNLHHNLHLFVMKGYIIVTIMILYWIRFFLQDHIHISTCNTSLSDRIFNTCFYFPNVKTYISIEIAVIKQKY